MRRAIITIVVVIGLVVAAVLLIPALGSDNGEENTADTSEVEFGNSTSGENGAVQNGQSPSGQTDDGTNGGDEDQGEASVNIDNMQFSPGTITVKRGTTVTWTNNDSLTHTVTPDSETDEFRGSSLSPGETYAVTFNTTGTYNYHCQPHPHMTGTVTVIE